MAHQAVARFILISIQYACSALSDTELAAINNAAQCDLDPRKVAGYEKAAYLFTEEGGTKMHAETKDALARIVLQRLSADQGAGTA